MTEPDDRELDRRVAKLPRSIHPERDLWADIERRIATRRAGALSTHKRKIVAAGAVSIVAAAAALSLVWMNRTDSLWLGRVERALWPWPSPKATALAVTAPPTVSPSPAVDPLEHDQERATYRAAVLALEASFADSRGNLSSDVAVRIEQSLGVLDQAILATEQALARDPESAELKSQLCDEYQQKIDALTAVVDLVTRSS